MECREQFYVEMKLGDPPKPFRFHVDTGSGWMWVYCTESDFESFIDNVVRTLSVTWCLHSIDIVRGPCDEESRVEEYISCR